MCGRFTLTRRDLAFMASELDAIVRPEDMGLFRPRYNIAPTDQHWILRSKYEQRQLLPATWGLINSWQPDAKQAARQINARSERAPSAPAFRDAFDERRCVVPADGFFEWVGAKEARRPIWFHAPDDGLLLFAGLYASWRDPAKDEWRKTFTILTTGANGVVEPVHDRMPVILPPERVDAWLFVPPDETRRRAYAMELRTMLAPAADAVLVATPVSKRVNSVQNDDPAVLEPANDAQTEETPRLL